MKTCDWQRLQNAFSKSFDARFLFESTTHVEALSRMMFLVEEHRRCATLAGAPGTGKSFVLQTLARQLQRTQRLVVAIDLAGLDEQRFLWNLAAGLRIAPGDNDSTARLWRLSEDCLRGMRHSSVPRVFLFDNVDRTDGCVTAVDRLLQLDAGSGSRTSTVMTGRSFAAEMIATLAEVRDVRIELHPFDHDDTVRYIAERMKAADGNAVSFDDDALDAIYRATDGFPRDVNRVCELAMLTAMQTSTTCISTAIVQTAVQEWRPEEDAIDGIPLLLESA